MKRKAVVINILSFFAPVMILFLCLFSLGIFPFGENSFLYWDSELQYINFFSYLKSTLTSNNNLFYSLSNLGGNNMLDFSAYYNFFSPFNIIFFLFEDKYLNIALELIMILKIGFTGLTMSYFLNKEVKESYLSVIISTSWALSMHTIITTMTNFILMDGIILLPLVFLGVSKIIEKKDYKLYLISSVFALLSNAYIAYVTILFSVIFFIYKIFQKENPKEYFIRFKTLFFCIIFAIGFCAWLLAPVLHTLPEGKYEYFNILDNLFEIRIDFLDIIANFYSNNLTVEFWKDQAPYIFVGILNVILFIHYFFNFAFSKKEKIANISVALLLFLGFMLNILFTVFNMGVENPCGTIYRFGFIFVFFVLHVAYKELVNLSGAKKENILTALLIFSLMSFFVYTKGYEDLNNVSLAFDTLYGFLILFLICKISSDKNKIAFLIVLILFHSLNLFLNTRFVLSSQRQCSVSSNIHKFFQYNKKMNKTLGAIYSYDKDFYRIASKETFIEREDRQIMNNNAFLNSFDSISGYSSLGKTSTREFYFNLGVPVYLKNMLFYYTEEMQNLPVSFLGVKYVISSNENLQLPYEKIKKDDFYIYKNPYSFPFGFYIDDNKKLYEQNYNNIIDFQNNILKTLFNKDLGNIYIYKKARPIFDLIKEKKGQKSAWGIYYGSKEDINSDKNTYLMVNSDIDAGYFMYETVIDNDGNITRYPFNDLNTHIYYLGDKINSLKIRYMLYKHIVKHKYLHKYLNKINVYFIEENLDILKKYSDIANNNKCEIKKISSSHYNAQLNIKENKLLLLTIPYDEGWNIKINGKTRKPIKVLNSLMAIPVETNDKELDMKFIPKGFYLGLIISIFSLFVFLIYRKRI
ncbi:MAG: YfhO family protein [Candidatus Gastranaerophilales bacterium]|nr:YfhO family protein [Candidatus Gastranaerophilales bacterium]